ncbi:DUF1456 family protein [Helicovermis profundi]|uniref:DUF1456 family protein n=1 Tax=Helicovermis profundi TaxID=3065157 RepID=A0AAU9EVV6_9FIRM|nr:DUF1456 family protein [Clostridia bacterium S502]
MNNTERLMRISNALDFKAADLVKIFKLDQIEMSEDEAELLLQGKNEKHFEYEDLESFLNGLIVFFRGEKPLKDGQEKRQPTLVEDVKSINNVILKKMKIALSLNSEDMLQMFKSVQVEISKDKLTTLFRKESHKSYRYCSDVIVIGFLKAVSKRR